MRIFVFSLISVLFLFSCKSNKEAANSNQLAGLNNETDSLSYAIGVSVASGIMAQGVDTVNPSLVEAAFNDVFYNKEGQQMDAAAANQYLNLYFAGMGAKVAEKNRIEGEKFLEGNKNNEGVVTTDSGMQYKILKAGEGESPTKDAKVTTHYEGKLLNGTIFDSSYQRGEPASFPVSGVIAGWTEALQLMKPGGKWRLWVPGNLAYGDRGAGDQIGPNQLLVFDVELISFE